MYDIKEIVVFTALVAVGALLAMFLFPMVSGLFSGSSASSSAA